MDTPKTKKRERVTPPKAPAPPKPKVEDPLENFDVQKVMSNGSGQIKGLEANQDYFVIKTDGKKVDVTVLPFARLSPPVVRRSVLISQERDEPNEK